MSETRADLSRELDDARAALGRQENLLRELLLEKYEPIAIVGVGLRFPGGSTTLAEFEEFLRAGRSGTGPIPDDRWDVDGYFSAEGTVKGKTSASGGGFLGQIDRFDPGFFNISPKEAQYIDPQHRLGLETAWEALEDANIDPSALRGANGGVYVGISCFDYTLEIGALADDELDAYVGTGTAHSALPGRISYLLGWRGPSIAIDTACSSSIVALDLAVQGLRRGDCEIAITGGVNAIHHPLNHIVFSQAGMLSTDGRCKTFDESADGYARSEGAGMIVLKRLSDAKRDGDRILALIRGTAVRQDGESGGLTVPNSVAQEAVMRAALDHASLRPDDVQYVEAHGTGTSLGDPIEMRSISGVFAGSHTPEKPVVVGSLKTNIGHMEAAAGIGGVIKTALQLHHGRIYPHLHVDHPSGHIPWDRAPVAVPRQVVPWQAPVRRAVVNSFGFAGTIASAVLEQTPDKLAAPAEPAAVPAGESEVFVLSAKSPKALRLQAAKYHDFLTAHPEVEPRDVCYTAAVGRAHFDERLAGVVSGRDELLELLAREPAAASGDTYKVAMLFTGQGSQYPGMGRALYERYPEFRARLDECDRLFARHLGLSIRDLMFDADADRLERTEFAQPALFAVEYATAKLWLSWGIEPSVLIGHSIGEVVAAAIAGLFSLEDAVLLVAARARLMQSVSAAGGMVSVAATADELAPLVAEYPDLAIAAVNAPGFCVVSGAADALAEIVERLTAQGVKTKPLAVSHAFHSPLMHQVFDAFAAAISGIAFREPDRTLISNVTGAVAPPELISTPEYWVRHIGAPVDFAAGMAAIAERGRHAFVEVGPAATLLGLGRRCVDPGGHLWLGSLNADDTTGEVLRKSAAELYRAGLPISWADYFRGREGRRITLPAYAFDRRRYWLPATAGRKQDGGGASLHHPLLGAPAQHEDGTREFRATINPDQPRYLRDHVVMGQVVVPAAAYVEVLLALQDVVFGETGRPLRDVGIHEPLIVSDEYEVEVRTVVRLSGDGRAEVGIFSRIAGEENGIERRHVTAVIDAPAGSLLPELAESASVLRGRAAAPVDAEPVVTSPEDLYADFDDLGLSYGTEFARITSLVREGEGVAVAELRGYDTGSLEHLPPFLLDNVIQSVAGVLDDGESYLPVGFGTLQLLKKPKGSTLRSLLRITSDDLTSRELTADMLLLDGDRLVFVARGLAFRRVVAGPNEQRRQLFHETRWIKRSLVRTSRAEPRDVVVVNRTADRFGNLAGALESAGIRVRYAADAAGLAALLAERKPTDVCWFWRPAAAGTLHEEAERNYTDLLAALDVLQRNSFGQGQRCWLVTEGAQRLPGDPAGAGTPPLAASLWGFGRSLWSESPAYRPTLVDVPEGDYAPLLDEWQLAEADEFQIAYRDGHRHVRRIQAVGPAGPRDENFTLSTGKDGEFAGIRRTPIEDVDPQGTEVQVRIHAAGINFKDVLNALGLLEQHAVDTGTEYHELPLGFEGAGTVLAAGPDAEFEPGDEVIVSHLGCMRKRVTVPSVMVVRKPPNIGFAEAAGLPTAYVTAYYALHTLAGIKRGDRVLIHAAAGGVGQAAVALAKLAGAEIYATASPGKHEFLRAQGIEHVLNSRTLEFADRLRDLTGGRGVDIVLNSLNKDFIPAGVGALADGGRFVELGKIGIWSPEQVRAVRPDIAYHNFDLSEFPEAQLQRINKDILETVSGLLAAGEIAPITTTEYTLDEIEEAFGVLSRGANIGKLVLDFTGRPALGAGPGIAVDPDETYLITGGLGALGVVTARKLVDEGARHLSLVSRRQPDERTLAELAGQLGADVQFELYQGDIADAVDVERIVKAIGASGRPLGGIVHAAGVLADGPISSMTWDQIDKVFRTKVYGTWLLHQAAAKFPELKFFVGYSSMSAALGPAGQANYAAGNAFIDAVMEDRAAAGRPALSVGWGPWAEVGMAAGLTEQMIKGIEGQGLRFLKPRTGARALWKLLGQPVTGVLVGEVEWDRFVPSRPAANALFRSVARSATVADRSVDLAALLALPKNDRRAAINEAVRRRIADLLRFDDADDISPQAKFMELGVDSLMAVEMKNVLESAFRVALPTSAVFDYPSVALLAAFVDEQLVPASATEDTGTGAVAVMSEEDIDAELAALRGM
ncbi:type I polyketide synthase [Amycolatopsis sp. NPDC005003]